MSIKIVSVYPDVLGTYGDHGNARILAHLVRQSGEMPEVIVVGINDPVPADGAVYLLGGGEDGPQALAARQLAQSSVLRDASEQGRPILAVCAGYQILGRSFVADGQRLPGLGLLPVESVPAPRRMVGEVLGTPLVGIGQALMSGFENHGAMTVIDRNEHPLGRVYRGGGNDGGGFDGIIHGSIIGSYLHGPILARNPGLALWILGRVGLDSALASQAHWSLYHERTRAQQVALWRRRGSHAPPT